MTRSTPRTIANTNKRRGAMVERVVADHLAKHTGLAVEPRRLAGAADRGDLAGLPRIVVEVKSGKPRIPAWLRETETERRNAKADAAVLWWAPPGLAKRPDRHVVITTDLSGMVLGAHFGVHACLDVAATLVPRHTATILDGRHSGYWLARWDVFATSGLVAATEWNWKVFA